ncbi:acyltransferase family protein [Streptomyces litchfieldiae]|uniref:Acyltransferase family protein n=1 Tax=Streptomyces litchfieldiae TaxID=3075543 RepID=A0ABU2MMB4_9ACTN|nr:acyltransferase family protein [Streptomyces sp. DSM 44938]MDT0342739.1 acyltransferase family protein [Streptomyces sp. DSM 44938]
MSSSRQTAETPAGKVTLPRQADAPARGRDAFFDNAKFLAIVLVAAAHAWEPLRGDSRSLTALYMTVYAFHMPAFIIIAGYFSRSFDGSPRRVARLVTGVAVPYVIFQIAYTYFLRRLDDDTDTYLPLFEPKWLMWFLLALFIWRLTVPLWHALRYPLPVALALAAVASASPSLGGDLQIQRVLQFLPFFVLGLVLRAEHFTWVRRRAVRLLALPVFAGALAVAYWAAPRMEYQWLYHRETAQELGEPWWAGIAMTLVLFGCSLLLTACFFALVPGRTTWFTALGAGTLYGYLLHGFLIQGSRAWGWYDPEVMRELPTALPLTTAAAAVAVALLCTPLVQRIFRPLMEPRLAWLFKREPGRA